MSKFLKPYRKKLKPRTTVLKVEEKFAYTISHTLGFMGWWVYICKINVNFHTPRLRYSIISKKPLGKTYARFFSRFHLRIPRSWSIVFSNGRSITLNAIVENFSISFLHKAYLKIQAIRSKFCSNFLIYISLSLSHDTHHRFLFFFSLLPFLRARMLGQEGSRYQSEASRDWIGKGGLENDETIVRLWNRV